MGDELTKRYEMYAIQQAANRLRAQRAQCVSNADVARGLARAQQQGGMSRGPGEAASVFQKQLRIMDDPDVRAYCRDRMELWVAQARRMLARALFETDERVIAFIDRVGERSPEDDQAGPRQNDTRWMAAADVAWERDEHGWRTEAMRRAEAIADRMRGAR